MPHELLSAISKYCKSANIAETTFGSMAVKDSRLVERIRDGKVTLRTITRVEKWMSENPPNNRDRRGLDASKPGAVA